LDEGGKILKDENGQEVKLKGYVDGELHNYVTLFYEAGDVKSAEKLGETVAGQLESIIKYFDESDVEFMTEGRNREDFLAAMHAYYVLNTSAINAGEEKGKLATRTNKMLKYYNGTMYPRMIKELKARAKENGESVSSSNGGPFSGTMRILDEYKIGMAMEFGYMAKPKPSNGLPQGGNEMPSMEELEAMLKAQNPTQDSTSPQ
jgi:hypothetical protein